MRFLMDRGLMRNPNSYRASTETDRERKRRLYRELREVQEREADEFAKREIERIRQKPDATKEQEAR